MGPARLAEGQEGADRQPLLPSHHEEIYGPTSNNVLGKIKEFSPLRLALILLVFGGPILLFIVCLPDSIRHPSHVPPTPPLPDSFYQTCTSRLTPPSDTYSKRLSKLASTLPPSTIWIAEPGPSATYFIGAFSSKDWRPSERPFLIGVSASPSGEPRVTLLTPAFEALRASLIHLPEDVKERATWVEWREDQSPYAVLADVLGAETEVEAFFLDGMARQFVCEGLRAVLREETGEGVKTDVGLIRERKDVREVWLLRCANQMTLHAIRRTRERMFFGITESATSKILKEEMAKTGLVGGEGLVLFGEDAALPHGTGTDRKLGKRDLVLIDAGGKWGGYVSDITRTFALPGSDIPQSHIEIWETVRRAQRAPHDLLLASNASAPPIFADLDKSARSIITSWTAPSASISPRPVPDFTVFTHRLGHGIGLEGHEAPYLVQGPQGERQVAGGHVFSLEPGVYLPATGEEVHGVKGVGVRLEDCIFVYEDEDGRLGGEWLSGPVGHWGDI
ncbi:hypothetical protein IAT38_001681 [Cryptococcus sp. DSM 104549]